MDKQQPKEIEKTIQIQIEETEKTIIEYKELTKPISPENSIGRISRMDAINNKSVAEAALQEAKNKLSNLIAVEKRINDEDFGICAKCRQSIPLGRILKVPHSRFCVKCAR